MCGVASIRSAVGITHGSTKSESVLEIMTFLGHLSVIYSSDVYCFQELARL